MSEAVPGAARRRIIATLFGGVALGAIGFYAVTTLAPIVARDMTGSTAWSGAIVALSVLGTAVGALVLSRVMARVGRRPGLVAGYVVGVAGGVVAAAGVAGDSFPAVVVGFVLLGVGHAANQLARYVGAEVTEASRRGSVLGLVVWAGTVGAVIGPNALGPSSVAADIVGVPDIAGGFVLAVVCYAAGSLLYVLMLRPEPSTIAVEDVVSTVAAGSSTRALLRRPQARIALPALVVAQSVMIGVMAITPVHVRDGGHGIAAVGVVMSSHFFGMFGLSPLAGGLADRIGRRPTIVLGFAVLTGGALAAGLTPAHSGVFISLPLFALGLGWALTFVSGSTLLTEGLAFADRTRLQGTTDALMWTSAAVASVASGALVEAASYRTLCIVGAAVAIVGAIGVLAGRRPAPVIP